jgi:hypothetical protein
LIDEVAISKYELSEHSGIIFLPTYWFAGAWQQLYGWNNTFQLWICLALTIVIPLLSIWLVIKYFAPSFNRKLSMITGDTGEISTTGKRVRKNPSSAYSTVLAKLFTKSGIERMSFLFTWKMMLRSRNFKMKVYPTIGYMFVIIVLMLMKNKTISLNDIAAQTKQGILYTLIMIYLSNLILIAALGQMTMYEKYKAAWVFFATPVDKPGKIISGSIKAAIAQFFFPLITVILILLITLAGPIIIPNIIFGIANELLITAVAAYINVSKLPFSSPQQNNSGSGLRVFVVMILGFVLAFVHYLLYPITIVVAILTVLSLTAAWYILGSINNLSWAKVYSSYSDE